MSDSAERKKSTRKKSPSKTKKSSLKKLSNTEEELNELKLLELLNIHAPEESSSSAAAPKSLEKIIEKLEKTSKKVANLSAAATRSHSAKNFAKISDSLAESAALAADATLISRIKTQLITESKFGADIIEDLDKYGPNVCCQKLKMFLTDLYVKNKGLASTSLHKFLVGSKAYPKTVSCHRSEKEFLDYLLDIIGQKPRGILFDRTIFNKESVPEYGDKPYASIDDFYRIKWSKLTPIKGGSHKKRRRHHRTRKI